MKCTISATEPSILRDAKPGDLFMLCDARERECVFALLDPATPYRSTYTGEISMLRIVVIACRVEPFEPGHHRAGTLLMLSPETPIQFVEQTAPAHFTARRKSFCAQSKHDATFGIEPTFNPGDKF